MPQIGQGEKAALLEGFAAAAQLLPPASRKDFVLIGGTSMLTLGGTRWTEDVDVIVTGQSLNTFEEAAAGDPRFSKDAMATWTYAGSTPETRDICVWFEFLGMGDGFAPVIRVARPALGGFRAGLGELALMKARALENRGEDKDRTDLRFVLEKMEHSDESFAGVEMDADDLEILHAGVAELGGRYSILLNNQLRRRAM